MATILVVDDDPDVCDVICGVLEADGHQTLAFSNGTGVLAQISCQPVDLLITDIFMPEVDGLQTIREVRLRCRDIPIIAMSGIDFGGQDYLEIAKKFGADAALKKPFAPTALRELVGSLTGFATPARPPR